MADLVTSIPSIDPGDRLLCGPGPSNVHPKVLEAMQLPINGHLDPDFWDLLLDLVEGLKALWRRSEGLSLCFSASGTSGMEPGMANLVRPGDALLVLHAGVFGPPNAETARRAGADRGQPTAPSAQILPLVQAVDR